MKIAMLIARFPPAIGGAEIQCRRLSQVLAAGGHQVVVLTERHNPALPFLEGIDGFSVIRFRTFGPVVCSSFLYGVQSLFYLLRHPDFDIFHAHMIATPAMVGLLAGVLLHKPVLAKVAGGRSTGDFGTSGRTTIGRLKLWLLRKSNLHLVCPSRETFAEARAFGIPEDRLSCIPNGIDTDHFRPAAGFKRRDLPTGTLPWTQDTPIAIYVGRWAQGKGVETLLEVWEAGTRKADFPWSLLMVLADLPPEKIASRINNLGIRIHMACGVADLLPYYQAADLAILLSEGEGLSNFLLEAMACGIPALTTDAAALPEAGEAIGMLTVPANDRTVEGSLKCLPAMQDPERRARMGQAARRHVEAHYAFKSVGPSYVSLYQKMLN